MACSRVRQLTDLLFSPPFPFQRLSCLANSQRLHDWQLEDQRLLTMQPPPQHTAPSTGHEPTPTQPMSRSPTPPPPVSYGLSTTHTYTTLFSLTHNAPPCLLWTLYHPLLTHPHRPPCLLWTLYHPLLTHPHRPPSPVDPLPPTPTPPWPVSYCPHLHH